MAEAITSCSFGAFVSGALFLALVVSFFAGALGFTDFVTAGFAGAFFTLVLLLIFLASTFLMLQQ